MSLFIASINSGSNGNCYYVGNQQEAVLIDAGISCRETEKRMTRLGLSMDKVKAIFVSHEHSDHIRGIYSIASKYVLPVYITEATHRHSGLHLDASLRRPFRPEETVRIGELSVTAFSKHHDAADPHSFVVEERNIRIGVITDIGTLCENVARHFQTCHAAFLEANYDEEMLANGRYPYYLKKRITSGKGHISNKQALQLFTQYRPENMSHLLLSHISKENNHPELAYNVFAPYAEQTRILIASRYRETEVFEINPENPQPLRPYVGTKKSNVYRDEPAQLSLF
jgi:phosphoribosyl 1,2-cyclic phosphodiesterase